MAEPIVKLKVEDSSFNAKIKEAAKTFADFGKRVASAGADAFTQFAKGAKTAKAAFEGFNAALKANALVLVASLAIQAASAIGEMIGDWITGANDAADAQDRLNQKLEETAEAIERIKDEGDFNARIAKAAGASTTEVLKMKLDSAREAYNTAMATLFDPNVKVGTEEYNTAKNLFEQAEKRLKKAQQDLKVDEVAKANKTGEYAPRGGGGGRSGRTVVDPLVKFQEQWNKTFRSSLANSSTFKAEDGGPSAIWQALQEKADEIKQVDIVSPLQAMRDELKTLTGWRDKAQTPEEWQKRNKSVLAKQNQIKQFTGGNESEGSNNKTSTAISQMANGVGTMVSSIQRMGIEIPEGLSNVLGTLQTITAIVSGIESLVAVGNFLGIFHTGGVVHAANGFAGKVPGRHFSGDNVPALLDAGEIVLTRAMAGNLASQLNSGIGALELQATVRGEQLKLALNNNGRRTGRGEYVQSNKMR